MSIIPQRILPSIKDRYRTAKTRACPIYHDIYSNISRACTRASNSLKQAQNTAPKQLKQPQGMRNQNMKKLNSISDVRRYFHRNETPIYFISATNFNLLGISEWVKDFRYINYIDCFDGRHPSVRIPEEQPHREFEGIEDINNYLLSHKEVIDYIEHRGPNGKAVFLMFDEQTEKLCDDLGLDVWFPSAELRQKLDNKIETVRIGDRAGVPSVPNILARVSSYEELVEVSEPLGNDLVLQSAFGDSGKTTYFISNEQEWDKYSAEIIEEPEMKIMKRVNCRGSAIEACTTKCGTIVGPLMTELALRNSRLIRGAGVETRFLPMLSPRKSE
jgi:hypothetical protein